jgi:hypothetical protein
MPLTKTNRFNGCGNENCVLSQFTLAKVMRSSKALQNVSEIAVREEQGLCGIICILKATHIWPVKGVNDLQILHLPKPATDPLMSFNFILDSTTLNI